MTANQQSILAELYDMDPGLRKHEAELIPLLRKLLERDPAQKPSPAFVKKLRTELAARMNAMASGAIEHRVSYAAPSGFFGRFAYALAGATAAVVIAVPVTLQWAQNGGMPVAPLDEMAAGKIGGGYVAGESEDIAANPNAPSVGNDPASYAMSRTQAGGGGSMGMDGSMSAVSSLIAPWNPVKYRLEGDLPNLPHGTVEVLERNQRPLDVPFNGIMNAFKDAAIDLSSFEGTSVENISVTQRKQFGYTINISMHDGSVSINQAWEYWPHPESDCRDETCYQRLRPTVSDVPADAEAIRIADAFIAEHDIDLSGYGEPIVDNVWRREYERAEDKRMAWVPESVRVVYPLLVDGKTVNDAGGGPSGISVHVSVKHKRVSDMWGLMTYQFSRKDHDAVSDRADVEKFISIIGGQTPEAPTVTLSDPTIGYVRLSSYEDGKNTEMFVPALIFQVTDVPDGEHYYQTTVAVPLAKDLLDKATSSMPMPLDRGPAIDVPSREPTPIENAAR